MWEEGVVQENSKTPWWRRQKQSFQWTNPKQQTQNIKMMATKKLQFIEDMWCNLFSMKFDQVEELKTIFLKSSLLTISRKAQFFWF
jgi:hypothetical protein